MSQSISTKTLFNSFNAIAKNWPRDPLRPEHQFGPQLQQAAKSVLTNSKGKSKITQLENDEELQKLEFKSFTQEETDYAQKALQSLENLRGNKAAKEFETPKSILHPASNPNYYTRLLNTLEGASRGRKSVISWGERVRIFFGGKPV